MALRRLSRFGRALVNDPCRVGLFRLSPSGWMDTYTGAKRHLLPEDIIRLQDFQQKKLSVAHRISGSKGNYIELFKDKLQRNEMILQDELKLLLHLCQSQKDMVVARDAIYKFHAENKNVGNTDFKFGPLFVRLCYEMGLEDMAATVLTDQSMKGFFRDCTSFNITINMLFKKGSYDNAMEVLKTMRNQSVHFNKETLTLAAGTCYKLNTPQSYRICMSLFEEVQTKGFLIPRHAHCFGVALALRQNDMEKAQLLYSQIISTNNRLSRNLHISLLAMSGRMKDAISTLSAAVSPKSPSFVKKPEFSQELLDVLHSWNIDGPHEMELEKTVTRLKKAGQVTELTLDDMLCQVPTGKWRQAPLMEERRGSWRTLRPLQSTLLSE